MQSALTVMKRPEAAELFGSSLASDFGPRRDRVTRLPASRRGDVCLPTGREGTTVYEERAH